MQISALILALLSATTLAAPFDLVTPPHPQPTQPQATEQKPRLGALLTSWPDSSCGKSNPGSADGIGYEVGESCVSIIDDQRPAFQLTQHYGVLEVFGEKECKGTRKHRYVTEKAGSEKCIDKGEELWASVRISVPLGTEWKPPSST